MAQKEQVFLVRQEMTASRGLRRIPKRKHPPCFALPQGKEPGAQVTQASGLAYTAEASNTKLTSVDSGCAQSLGTSPDAGTNLSLGVVGIL